MLWKIAFAFLWLHLSGNHSHLIINLYIEGLPSGWVLTLQKLMLGFLICMDMLFKLVYFIYLYSQFLWVSILGIFYYSFVLTMPVVFMHSRLHQYIYTRIVLKNILQINLKTDSWAGLPLVNFFQSITFIYYPNLLQAWKKQLNKDSEKPTAKYLCSMVCSTASYRIITNSNLTTT